MKKILASTLFVSTITVSVNAADYEMRSEFIYCVLNDGMTLKDAADQAKEYGKFSKQAGTKYIQSCLLYTSPSPRDREKSRMPSSA